MSEVNRRDAIKLAATGAAVGAFASVPANAQEATTPAKVPMSGLVGIGPADDSVFIAGEGEAILVLFSPEEFNPETMQHDEKLGDVCWMETRLHIRKPCRDCRAEVWAEFTHPRIGEAADRIRHCLRVAAVAAVITSLIAAISRALGSIPAVAVSTFRTVLIQCLIREGVDFAREISINVELRHKDCESWTSNCEPCD